MAENSIFWTTGSTGDGLNPYTQSEVVDFYLRKFYGFGGYVLPGVDNALAVTGTTSPVAVDTGAASVYGFPYENTASINVAVPTPSASTRIDRIILRVSWAAQTVRVVRLAGTEGAGAPSLTQNPGTTYEVSLAQVSITTGGVITVTDERQYAHYSTRVNTSMLDDNAVTAAKVANRTRRILVPLLPIKTTNYLGNYLDSATGVKLLDAETTTCIGFFACPEDFASSMVAKPVLIGSYTSAYNVRLTLSATAGNPTTGGEDYNTHNTTPGIYTKAVPVAATSRIFYGNSMTITGVAIGDTVGLKFLRSGADALDTFPYTLGFPGVEITYTADG